VDSLVGEYMNIWNGSVTNSTIGYQTAYQGRLKLDKVPSLGRVDVSRREVEEDVLLRTSDERKKFQFSPDLNIKYNGRRHGRSKIYNGERLPDPCKDEEVILAPIEVRYHPMVIEKMRSVSVEIATDSEEKVVPKETGGYLGGQPMQDNLGRWYTYVSHVEADSKYDAGTSMTFEFTTKMQYEMVSNILDLGLYPVGFWHSHPTYQPFQSDSRLNSKYGNDVQTTYSICTHWWEVAAVIDPFTSDSNWRNGDVALGNYKINGNFDDPVSYEMVGWRSISTGITRIPSWNYLMESKRKQNEHEKKIREWEKNYYISRAKAVLEDRHSSEEMSLSEVQFLKSRLEPMLTFGEKVTDKEARNLISLIRNNTDSGVGVDTSWQEDIEWDDTDESGVLEEE
jgi:proteasome lid subunit RPN8/RPN11